MVQSDAELNEGDGAASTTSLGRDSGRALAVVRFVVGLCSDQVEGFLLVLQTRQQAENVRWLGLDS